MPGLRSRIRCGQGIKVCAMLFVMQHGPRQSHFGDVSNIHLTSFQQYDQHVEQCPHNCHRQIFPLVTINKVILLLLRPSGRIVRAVFLLPSLARSLAPETRQTRNFDSHHIKDLSCHDQELTNTSRLPCPSV